MKTIVGMLSVFIFFLHSNLFAAEIQVDWVKSDDRKYIIFNAYEKGKKDDVVALLIETNLSNVSDTIWSDEEISDSKWYVEGENLKFYAKSQAEPFLDKIGLTPENILKFRKDNGFKGTTKAIIKSLWDDYISRFTISHEPFNIGENTVTFQNFRDSNKNDEIKAIFDYYKSNKNDIREGKLTPKKPILPHLKGKVVVIKVGNEEVNIDDTTPSFKIDFGEITEGMEAKQTVTFKNIGKSVVNISVEIDSNNGFSSSAEKFSIDPGNEYDLDISFKSLSYEENSTNEITFKDIDNSDYTINSDLIAKIVPVPSVYIDDNGEPKTDITLKFDPTPAKVESDLKSITLKNPGTKSVTIKTEAESGYGVNFTAELDGDNEGSADIFTIEAEKSKKINIHFTPKSYDESASNASVTVKYSNHNTTLSINLKGKILPASQPKGSMFFYFIWFVTAFLIVICLMLFIRMNKQDATKESDFLTYVATCSVSMAFTSVIACAIIIMKSAFPYVLNFIEEPIGFLLIATAISLIPLITQSVSIKQTVISWLGIIIVVLIVSNIKGIDMIDSQGTKFLATSIVLIVLTLTLTGLLICNLKKNYETVGNQFSPIDKWNKDRKSQLSGLSTDSQANIAELIEDLEGLEEKLPLGQSPIRNLSPTIQELKKLTESFEKYVHAVKHVKQILELEVDNRKDYLDNFCLELDDFKDEYDKNEKNVGDIYNEFGISKPNFKRLFEAIKQAKQDAEETRIFQKKVVDMAEDFERPVDMLNAYLDSKERWASLNSNIKRFKINLSRILTNLFPEKFETMEAKMLSEILTLIEKGLGSVNQLLSQSEKEKQIIRKNISPVLSFFEVEYQQMRELPQLFQEHEEYIRHKDIYLPSYMQNYETLLHYMFENINEIYEKTNPDSKFRNLFKSLMYGEKNDAGIKLAIERMGHKKNREKLLEDLKIERYIELRHVEKKEFFEKHLKRNFISSVLHSFMRIYLYRCIDYKNLNLAVHYRNDGINIELLDEVCGYMKGNLRMNFGIQLSPIRLFRDRFDREKHETGSARSPLERMLAEYKDAQHNLERNIIYDIISVGIMSEELDFHIKPKVIVKV